jgi:hypothetical protein
VERWAGLGVEAGQPAAFIMFNQFPSSTTNHKHYLTHKLLAGPTVANDKQHPNTIKQVFLLIYHTTFPQIKIQ